jgi:hypothetical protein
MCWLPSKQGQTPFLLWYFEKQFCVQWAGGERCSMPQWLQRVLTTHMCRMLGAVALLPYQW